MAAFQPGALPRFVKIRPMPSPCARGSKKFRTAGRVPGMRLPLTNKKVAVRAVSRSSNPGLSAIPLVRGLMAVGFGSRACCSSGRCRRLHGRREPGTERHLPAPDREDAGLPFRPSCPGRIASGRRKSRYPVLGLMDRGARRPTGRWQAVREPPPAPRAGPGAFVAFRSPAGSERSGFIASLLRCSG